MLHKFSRKLKIIIFLVIFLILIVYSFKRKKIINQTLIVDQKIIELNSFIKKGNEEEIPEYLNLDEIHFEENCDKNIIKLDDVLYGNKYNPITLDKSKNPICTETKDFFLIKIFVVDEDPDIDNYTFARKKKYKDEKIKCTFDDVYGEFLNSGIVEDKDGNEIGIQNGNFLFIKDFGIFKKCQIFHGGYFRVSDVTNKNELCFVDYDYEVSAKIKKDLDYCIKDYVKYVKVKDIEKFFSICPKLKELKKHKGGDIGYLEESKDEFFNIRDIFNSCENEDIINKIASSVNPDELVVEKCFDSLTGKRTYIHSFCENRE